MGRALWRYAPRAGFIGQKLNAQAVIEKLDSCLLTDQELLAGKAYWQTLDDPFPEWQEEAEEALA